MPDSSKTVERRILSKRLRAGFLGPAYDQTDFCPVAIPGVSFDETEASHTAPFTPAEVASAVGFVELSLREVDSWDDDTTSGVQADGSITGSCYTLSRCRFDIRLPAAISSLEATLERYEEKIRELWIGLTVVHTGPPAIRLRQLRKYPARVWADSDDGAYRSRILDIPIRRWERRTHAGVQEVSL